MVRLSTSREIRSPSRTRAIGPAFRGLRRDVTHHETVRRAAEAPVGDENHGVAEAPAHDGAGDGEHLPHPRTALRTLPPDDDDVSLLNLSRLHGREGFFFGVEDPRRTLVARAVVARELHHRPLGGERAAENGDPASGFDRGRERPDDFLPLRLARASTLPPRGTSPSRWVSPSAARLRKGASPAGEARPRDRRQAR